MVDNKMRRLVPKSSHRPGPALPKFCTQEERKISKAMNTKQAEKKHKKPLVSWVNWKKSNKSGENQCGNILNISDMCTFPFLPDTEIPYRCSSGHSDELMNFLFGIRYRYLMEIGDTFGRPIDRDTLLHGTGEKGTLLFGRPYMVHCRSTKLPAGTRARAFGRM